MRKGKLRSRRGISVALLLILFGTTILISIPVATYASPISQTPKTTNSMMSESIYREFSERRWDFRSCEPQFTSLLALSSIRFSNDVLQLDSSMPPDLSPFGTPHAPIDIDDNTDFVTQGWPGNGTVEDPYVIAGLNINATATGGVAINITNTDVHFFIKDCWLTANSTSVIELNSIAHGRVKNNTILQSSRGVVALHSEDLTIFDNLFYEFSWAGVYMEDCSLSSLRGNNCTTCFIGLHIEQSNNIFIEDNYCTDCLGGIELYLGCEYITTHNNTLVSNEVGIGLYLDCEDNIIDSNNCTLTNMYGIYALECANNTILNNYGRVNGIDILLQNSTSHTIHNNDCGTTTGLIDAGSISLDNSNNSIITGNHVENSFICIEATRGSSHNEIANNTCFLYLGGIVAWYGAPYNTITNNTCDSQWSGDVDIFVETSSYCTVTENKCNHSMFNIVSIESNNVSVVDNLCYETTEAGIWFSIGYHVLIKGNTLGNGSTGIVLEDVVYGSVLDNTVSNFTATWMGGPTGIHLTNAYNSSVVGNHITECNVAIYMEQSSKCNITDNTCIDNQDGIFVVISNFDIVIDKNYCHLTMGYAIIVAETYNCTVTRNVCTNTTGLEGICLGVYDAQCDAFWNEFRLSDIGIDFEGHKGVITHNTIKDNELFGLYILGLLDVNVTWNIFDENGQNVRDDSVQTIFDYNYYSNYTGVDANADGIGDTWHPIDGLANNNDTHPLMYYPTSPTWLEAPMDQQAEYGEEFTYSISVVTSPKSAPISEWWINDSQFVINDGIISYALALGFGGYPLEVRAYNLYGYYVSGTFTVTVADTVAPTIIGPDDFDYIVGQVGRWITWIAEDHDPASYSVTLDGIEVMSGAWNSTAENVTISVDGLSVGDHTFVIVFLDGSGNANTDTVVVTVRLEDFTPLLFIAGIGAVAIVAITVIYLTRKKGSGE
ncbi:MAG: hypothetical protein AM326_04360 [Candidatus Thorarchaeota archaeon SMTZ-45]|nr:MAG: hypothetical protein AM326_04360 [Candidatus Thorarchaeota archaeon SMTZ-45]KXH75796.1 MAG: hypothetical protein AM325_03935 [Candidatus Thorarchaeota archaeon SMTZ1-45]